MMKKGMVLLLVITLFSCGNSVKTTDNSPKKKELDPQVALEVMNDYIENCNARKDSGKWVENQKLLTEDYKKDYKKMMREAWEDDPEMGLGFDPILDAQDYPDEGFKISSKKSSDDSIIILEGKDGEIVNVRLVDVNGKWFVDGTGVIRMPK
jgi:hypothetical protein